MRGPQAAGGGGEEEEEEGAEEGAPRQLWIAPGQQRRATEDSGMARDLGNLSWWETEARRYQQAGGEGISTSRRAGGSCLGRAATAEGPATTRLPDSAPPPTSSLHRPGSGSTLLHVNSSGRLARSDSGTLTWTAISRGAYHETPATSADPLEPGGELALAEWLPHSEPRNLEASFASPDSLQRMALSAPELFPATPFAQQLRLQQQAHMSIASQHHSPTTHQPRGSDDAVAHQSPFGASPAQMAAVGAGEAPAQFVGGSLGNVGVSSQLAKVVELGLFPVDKAHELLPPFPAPQAMQEGVAEGGGCAAAAVGAAPSAPTLRLEPQRCQIQSCQAELTHSKPYCKRYKLCESCISNDSVLVRGVEMRFCQQCSLLHRVTEFDGKKRSCRMKLERHKIRARRQRATQLSQAEDPAGTIFRRQSSGASSAARKEEEESETGSGN